jgi:hypothetical protein
VSVAEGGCILTVGVGVGVESNGSLVDELQAKVNSDSQEVARLKQVIKAYEDGTYKEGMFDGQGDGDAGLEVDNSFVGDASGEASATL